MTKIIRLDFQRRPLLSNAVYVQFVHNTFLHFFIFFKQNIFYNIYNERGPLFVNAVHNWIKHLYVRFSVESAMLNNNFENKYIHFAT